jgi:putative ABC transport system permease protein
VVFQFAITTCLIIAVFTISSQIKYLKSVDMGYNRQHVLVVPSRVEKDQDLLKERLKSIPSILAMGRINAFPGPHFLRTEIVPEDGNRDNSFTASHFNIDPDCFKTLDISVVKGRNFSAQFPTDRSDAVIINEKLAQKHGWDNPIGKRLDMVVDEGAIRSKTVVGVIKNFHYLTARQVIEPMIFFMNPNRSVFLLIRINPGSIAETVNQVESEFKKLFPKRQFRSYFLDERFNEQFSEDKDFARNIGIFTGLAILVACLGLIGLVAYAIEQRRREIVVRKVFGCSGFKIASILASSFLKAVILANVIAWPLGYLAINKWLNEFVFRVPFTLWPFIVALGCSIFIAVLTVSYQTLRAAKSNPVDVLREIG